jgi:hypothetical protein
MDHPIQIDVAVYHLAKLRMLEFCYHDSFTDKHHDRSGYQIMQMGIDSHYFAFS